MKDRITSAFNKRLPSFRNLGSKSRLGLICNAVEWKTFLSNIGSSLRLFNETMVSDYATYTRTLRKISTNRGTSKNATSGAEEWFPAPLLLFLN